MENNEHGTSIIVNMTDANIASQTAVSMLIVLFQNLPHRAYSAAFPYHIDTG